tara:strand:- start:110 stop:328 length:219 start_codon:yes stop_codon:yes gene_type:complete
MDLLLVVVAVLSFVAGMAVEHRNALQDFRSKGFVPKRELDALKLRVEELSDELRQALIASAGGAEGTAITVP